MLSDKIILFAFISSLQINYYSADEVLNGKIVQDFQQHFNAKWVVIHSCLKNNSCQNINLLKELKRDSNFYITIYDWEDFSGLKVFQLPLYIRPIVFLTCEGCGNDCLLQLNKLNEFEVITKFIWVLWKNNSTDFNGLYIPIDCLFIVVKKEAKWLKIIEKYQTSYNSDWRQNDLGTWSESGGLNLTKVPLYERRSDFYGQNITGYFKLPDRGLELAYPYFYLDIFIDVSNRLNINAQITHDTKTNHEVSLSVLPMSVAREGYSYLQTLHTTWIVLFFKDIQTEMLLDSFIKPFTGDVWLAIFAWITITAVALHKSCRIIESIYKKVTENKKPFSHYLFESLAIVLQKYEDSNYYFFSQRIAYIIHWITSMLVFMFYTAIFISFVTIIIRKPPFSFLEDILKDGTYNVVIARNTFQQYASHPDENIRKLITLHYDKERNTAFGLHEAIERICFSNQKLITIHTTNRYRKAKRDFQNCAISDNFIRIQFLAFSWLIKKNSPYDKILQYCLSKLVVGGSVLSLYDQRTNFPNKNILFLFHPIQFQQVLFLYLVLSGGTILSIFILLLEIYHSRLSR